mgnify:CR=1 FL=1
MVACQHRNYYFDFFFGRQMWWSTCEKKIKIPNQSISLALDEIVQKKNVTIFQWYIFFQLAYWSIDWEWPYWHE